ncbi:MAG: Hsp20 family protein [Nitrososphaeria archaeon]|nr:Hsp20 family protein [Nitrososphaeria archaeon]NIQ32576.1 Hsp20 family protein [Nitrososphaeria archaeon]
MSFWDDWFRRRRRHFPFFEEMDKIIEDMFHDFFEDMPKDFLKQRKLSDGSTVRGFGPFVYGYSVTMGPDGKPVIREFGNMKPSRRGRSRAEERREPLVEVISGDKVIQVLAELPGVEKSDINLDVGKDSLRISVNTEMRKYHKQVYLPEKVDPDSVKFSYKNGVLDVTINKLVERKPPGKRITID